MAEHEGGPGQTITLHRGGLATSTTTVRRWHRGGRLVHHIIDPPTEAPAKAYWRTVSVAADTALAADTASTAAIVLGVQAESWLRQRRLAARLVDHDGRVTTTESWPAPVLQVAR